VILRLTIADPVPGVTYSLCDDKNRATDPQVAGDGPLSLDIPVTLKHAKLTGPFVRREGPERRFVYIAIGLNAGDPGSPWSRRAKIDVHAIPPDLIEQAASGRPLTVLLPGRDKHGGPACATVQPLQPWRAL